MGKNLNPFVCLLIALVLSGCTYNIASVHAGNADERLESLMQQLPIPTDTFLLKRVNAWASAQMPECEGRRIEALLGTNNHSLEEVLEYYSKSLPVQGWHLRSSHENSRSFYLNDEFYAEISDLYETSSVGPDIVKEGRKNYQTLYLLWLYTGNVIPIPAKCQGG